MKCLHPDIPLEDEGTVSSKHSITGEVSTSWKATLGDKPEHIDLVEDRPLDRFANKDPTTKVGARKAVQRAIYKCINDLGFPSSTVEKPMFHALLETVCRNAKLTSNKDFEISNKLLSSIHLQSYNKFVQLISMLISNVRTRYEELCGKTTPFATLCHDCWKTPVLFLLDLLLSRDPQLFLLSWYLFLKIACLHVSFTAYENFYKLSEMHCHLILTFHFLVLRMSEYRNPTIKHISTYTLLSSFINTYVTDLFLGSISHSKIPF